MTSGKDFFKLELEEVLLTRQEIHTSLLNSEPETIEEEQITICQKELAKALWVIAHKLEQAHEDVINELGSEALWSLKDLAIYCKDQYEQKGLERPLQA